MEYMKIKLGEKSYDIELTDKDISTAKKEIFEKNTNVVIKVTQKFNAALIASTEKASLKEAIESVGGDAIYRIMLDHILGTMTQHWVYHLENFGRQKLVTELRNSGQDV